MIGTLQTFAGGISTALLGIVVGAAWITAMMAPNVSYDRLDASRADGHIRALLLSASTPLSGALLGAVALSVLAGHFATAGTAALATFGFFSNRWTLAPRKKGEGPPGARGSKKTQRVVAVGFTLMFTLVALIAAVLSVLGV